MTRITVTKLNAHGKHMLTYEGDLAETLPNGMRIDAYWEHPTRDLGYVIFETGDFFGEWYFTDHYFNILEIVGQDGALKGWYCNIAEPAQIEGGTITFRDLTLDLWVSPDGATLTLDEDEFEADATLDETTRAAALAGLAALRAFVASRARPFSRITPS